MNDDTFEMFTDVLFWMPMEPSPTSPPTIPREGLLQRKSRDKASLDSKSLGPGGIQGIKEIE